MAKGKVVQFRRSLKHYQPRHFILNVNVDSKEKAAKFVGKEVVWKSESGKLIKGKISDRKSVV
jgi:large subunit ribosomal protein L35Ae